MSRNSATARATGRDAGKEIGPGSDWPAEAISQVRKMLDDLAPFIPDPRARREYVIKQARLLTPRVNRGRPPCPEVELAAELKRQGKPWPAIYPAVIPNHAALNLRERRYEQDRLRRRVYDHRRYLIKRAVA